MSRKGIICSTTAVVGLCTTVALAIEETKRLENENNTDIVIPKKQAIKRIFKYYYPSMIVGVATATSIIAGCIIEQKTQNKLAALVGSVYGLYKQYGNEVKEKLGEQTHHNIVKEISKKDMNKQSINVSKNEELYWNDFIGHFTARPIDVQKARYIINRRMIKDDPANSSNWVSVHDFLVACNAKNYEEEDDIYSLIGWDFWKLTEYYEEGPVWIDINISDEVITENGVSYKIVEFVDKPIAWDTDNEDLMAQELQILERGYNNE